MTRRTGRLVWCRRLVAAAAGTAALAAFVLLASPAKASSGGSCDPYLDGTLIPVPCMATSGTSASSGGAGSGSVSQTCTTVPVDQAQAEAVGLSWPPPPGQGWALLDCLASVGAGPQAVLVDAYTGVPQVTPQQLMTQALGELQVPALRPATAPPPGTDGLVGLPEWFWIPSASWRERSVTVSAGPVWATVTASPVGLSFDPGGGLSAVSCAGPGTAYDPALPATAQQTACSYTYLQPSDGQPGNAYQAAVAVTWRVAWTGSGGTGGELDAALSVPAVIAVPVAQSEALVSSS